MKVLFVYPRFDRHADAHPELRACVPMDEYLGSPSLGIACLAAMTPPEIEVEMRDDRLAPADGETDADVVALSFFTPAATRALELADHFRSRGHLVVAGGVFPTAMPEVVAPHVDAVVVGEGEGVWRQVLWDAFADDLRPRYQAPVDVDALPTPDLRHYFAQERPGLFEPDDYPLQISRGCPLTCDACILPTSMTRQLRTFPLDHCVRQLDALVAAGKRACLTEDTSWFPSGRGHRLLMALLDHVVATGIEAPISYVGTSMPLILATPAEDLARARAAGVKMFYLVGGFDPVTRKAFTGEDPAALARAHEAVRRCHDAGIEPYTSFLLGGDQDDVGTVDRMLEFSDRARIRKAEFAIATPYPGTPQWRRMVAQDRILTRNWSKYNDANVVFRPARMTPDQLTEGYLRLWREFYATGGYLRELPSDQRTIQF